jgi:hypothetical protein
MNVRNIEHSLNKGKSYHIQIPISNYRAKIYEVWLKTGGQLERNKQKQLL